uniref:Uncharacterized protein n=1 Tax=Triticum urartu TaxID=4572 RepID=A0A8R7PFF6_TRIUA
MTFSHHNLIFIQKLLWFSDKREANAPQLTIHDAIDSLRHLGRYVLLPVPNLPIPEERRVAELPVNPVLAGAVRLHAPHPLYAAQRCHGLGDAPGRLLGRERAAEELGEPLHAPHRVLLDVLVPEEHDLLRPRQALPPVLGHVLPRRPERRDAVAERREQLLERRRGGARTVGFAEVVPERDERVLGVPAHVDGAAAGAGHGRRKRRERRVHGQHARRRHRLQERRRGRPVLLVDVVREWDEVVGAGAQERVAALPRAVLQCWRVRAAVRDGEHERLEPRGAGLGQGGDEDVGGAGDEGVPRGERRRHLVRRVPEAAVVLVRGGPQALARRRREGGSDRLVPGVGVRGGVAV